MTLDELKLYDGKNGAKAYIAYKNVVYDVSESPLWKNGEHQGEHNAGVDLTLVLANAPHGEEVFERYPTVGTLEASESKPTEKPPENLKAKLRSLYKKYHPHPMSVHFPIALHVFAAGFDMVFLATKKEFYESLVFYSFFVATVMGLVAMMPGLLSWWINYNLSTHRAFMVKIILSTLTLLLGIVAISIYLGHQNIAYDSSYLGITYHAIVLLTGLSVMVLGYYGGKIAWGEIKEEKTEPLGKNQETLQPTSTITRDMKMSQDKLTKAETHSGVSISILIGGAAGMGIETLEKILSDAFRASGFYVYTTKEFMSRVRGGSNTLLIHISDYLLEAPSWEVDISIALDKLALEHMSGRWTKNTILLADESLKDAYPDIQTVLMKESAKKFGDARYGNTYMAGVLFGILGIDKTPLLEITSKHFKDEDVNKHVAQAGYEDASKLKNITVPTLPKMDKKSVEKLHLMDGTTSCGFGFLAGGCNMITAYPMSPSTGLLNFMAAMSKEFDIAVEQTEDEIASLAMVIGGWYAGARAITSTSGGGFALMGELLSLSGMTETPAVIYLAQRPGPATGLPTRTEQGDLNLALYSGHGPFPRLILAPGSLKECIVYSYLALELADKYQIPAIVLSDQYLADTISMIENVDFSSYKQNSYITKSAKDYERYADVENGISPRAVPDFGEGIICAVSDEHDERGQITEDYKTRVQMVQKRERKSDELLKEALAPAIFGDGDIAIIGWGSTKGAIAESLRLLGDANLVHVHFAWVHPLSREQLKSLEKYKYKIVVENNADASFANQLKLHDVKIDKTILQSNGFSFFSDQLNLMIQKTLKELL